ncbi:MAG: hypothetical protein WC934_15285 [Acidithiobacillus sp.]|jgi:hypothetical protein|uniref:hypothetical protein n=1 Tax=Acidithiobacillus sp. TaxID=1872118 RepID=UPI00355F1150
MNNNELKNIIAHFSIVDENLKKIIILLQNDKEKYYDIFKPLNQMNMIIKQCAYKLNNRAKIDIVNENEKRRKSEK